MYDSIMTALEKAQSGYDLVREDPLLSTAAILLLGVLLRPSLRAAGRIVRWGGKQAWRGTRAAGRGVRYVVVTPEMNQNAKDMLQKLSSEAWEFEGNGAINDGKGFRVNVDDGKIILHGRDVTQRLRRFEKKAVLNEAGRVYKVCKTRAEDEALSKL